MIAQGEYIRLLHASSKERKEIFSRIFHTGIYGRIQQKLREADRTLYGRLEDNKTRCEEVIRQVTVPRTEEAVALEWEERWQSLKERYRTNGAELLAFLHQLSEESRRIEEEAGETGRECNPEACRRTEPSGACEKGKTGTGRKEPFGSIWTGDGG
ncbi:MAG: hypothetical protein ACLTR6_12310 [Clostridium fessum]